MSTAVPTPAAGPARRQQASIRSRVRLRALTVLAAAGAAAAGWAIARPDAGIRLAVRVAPAGPAAHVGLAAVIIAATLAGLAGWAALAILERVSQRPRASWTVTALAVLLLSLAGPLTALTVPAKAALACLHLLVGGVVIGGMRRRADRLGR